MARHKVSAGQVFDVLASARHALRGRDERVVLRVHVDPTCPRWLALAVKRALVAERPGGVVDVCGLVAPTGAKAPDVALVLVGGSDVSGLACAYARAGVAVGLVAEGALDVPELSLGEAAAELVGVVAASSPEALSDKLASWLADAAGEKDLALAANFAFCRPAVVDALVSRCALENAAIGAVSLIPGSDFPLMCVNQAKLALDVAAAYGQDLEPARALELAGVVGAGLGYRALARTLVGLVPGLGLALKAGIGYGGTLATGRALRLRFELEGRPGEKGAPAGAAAPTGREQTVLLASAPAAEDYVTIKGGMA